MTGTECSHGWPARECDRHQPSRARRALDWTVVMTLGLLTAASTAALAWGMVRFVRAFWGQP